MSNDSKPRRNIADGLLEILNNPSHPKYRELIAISEGVRPGDFSAARDLLAEFHSMKENFADWHEHVNNNPPSSMAIAQLILLAEESYKSRRGKIAADAKHSKAGGSRDKAADICKIWASGKYQSRDLCAEQECAALGMSFSTARKALRNTPNPS